MRLLVVSSWMPYPPDNGSKLRAFHLVKHLSRRHSLTLLALGAPATPHDVGPLSVLCERVDVIPARKVQVTKLGIEGLFSRVPRYYVQAQSLEMKARVGAAAPAHDAVLGLQIDVALPLVEVANLLPSVLDEIEVGVIRERYSLERHPLRRARHGLTWWKTSRFIRLLTDRFDWTTVVSERERELLRSIGCDVSRIAIVPNGFEVPARLPEGSRVGRLIYPGSVTFPPNLDAVRFFVQQVFPLIRRSSPNIDFTITGSTDGVDIAELAAVPGVVFTGRVADVDPLIAESTACVVPLRMGGGTRLKVLHAMALATPVVSTAKGIEGLEIEPGRHVLVADSPVSMAAEVLRIVNSSDLAARLGAAGRQLVQERYAWDPIAGRLEDVIRGAVEDRRAGRGAR